jgi:RHS repeat-associated protein
MQRVAALALSAMVPVSAAAQTETVTYYHLDAIGSVRMVTDAAGLVVGRYDYQPFGLPLDRVPPPPPERLQFAGKERDSETGFDYFGGRYYSSVQGRFTSPDPAAHDLVNPQTFNKYRYALNNPLRYIDRDGLYEEDVHKDLTTVLALAAGFSRETATAIGAATQWVDDDPRTDPTALANALNEQMRANYHFTSAGRRTAMWVGFERARSITAIGEYLHALQDSYSHLGYGARYGHASAGKAPDRTTNDPAKADRMAEATYRKLLAARGTLAATSEPIPYQRIQELVVKFNRADSKGKRALIDEMEQEIQHERGQ